MNERALRRGNWSVQELERLRQLLPRRGVADTAVLLRRSPDSVLKKAMEILRVPPRRGAWTSSDDDRLRESWGAVEPRLLAPMLGRPVAEVLRRAAGLRARLASTPWSREEIQTLKELYGTRRDADLEVCMLRPLADIRAMAALHCLAKDKRFVAHQARAATAPDGKRAEAQRLRMPRWREAEVALLREIYADADNLTVARRLGRTVTGVANKANQLGLRKSPRLLTDIGRQNVGLRYTGEPIRRAGAVGSAGASDVASGG